MYRASQVKLISVENTMDALGQMVPVETANVVPVKVASITRYEWAEASKVGVDPQCELLTPSINYNGEAIAEFEGKRYSIYRTFSDGDNIELYLERKAGI